MPQAVIIIFKFNILPERSLRFKDQVSEPQCASFLCEDDWELIGLELIMFNAAAVNGAH